jgi:cell cycle related kinase
MEGYRVLGCIGEGAHGVVFRATNIHTGEPVALKKVGSVTVSLDS